MPTTVIDESRTFLDKYVGEWFATGTKKPLFVFLSGPQGSGKSYNGALVQEYLSKKWGPEGKNVAFASIDDFYLTHEDQEVLEMQFPGNKLFKGRGLPGTHDMALLNKVIKSILEPREATSLEIPQYDKSKFSGAGDRSAQGVEVKLPIDIFVLEGWFLGFRPRMQRAESNDTIIGGDMADVNARLFGYSDLLWRNPEIHSLGIVLACDDINNVYTWRTEQEHATIKRNGSGMSDADVHKFVDRYMPCYEMYYDEFAQSESLGSVATLTLGVSLDRSVFATKTKCIE